MALTNTARHYGAITKSLHWATALLILTLIPTGWWANQLPYETSEQLAQKAWFFSLHKTLGVALFFVAVLRILWALGQPKPGLLNAHKKLESFAADLVHWLLYAALVVVPLSGWITHASAAGFAPIWWPLGQDLPFIPKSVALEHASGAVHWVATKVLIAALFLHIAGALKHHVIDKDATLRRMLPGQPDLPVIGAQKHSRKPLAGALVVWALVVGLGSTMGLSGDKPAAAAPALETAASEWTVETGTIQITVTQFGNDVVGTFNEWTSVINFDPDATGKKLGDVLTTISIPSLTLGSVTNQAMGTDFFNAELFPTAEFKADLLRIDDGYVADGNLSIRDNSVPVVLPFALNLEGERAEMSGTVTLDRMDFWVGANMPDESSLKFAVEVAIDLVALRGE